MAKLADVALSGLRESFWLGAARARAYLNILAGLSALATLAYLLLSHLPLDPLGRPLGTDFASFWTASRIALAGHPADVWKPPVHEAMQVAMFGVQGGYAAFFYPPTFLLACLPLALAPYTASLAIWLLATGAAWVFMCRAWLGPRYGWLPIIAFPAVLINAAHGQNGFLTAALLGAGALLSGRRPILAGALVGLLIIKPHLAVLTPLFFLLSGNWKAMAAAAVTAGGLCLLSLLLFGLPSWQGFLQTSPLARAALEQNLVGYAKMQSAFAAARLLGAPISLAWLIQGLAALGGVIAMWRVGRSRSSLALGAALACATLLATPFLLDYDLTLLAVPLAWLFTQAMDDGFRPWERLILLAGFVLPLLSRVLAMTLHVPVAPIVVTALLLCIVRRATAPIAAVHPLAARTPFSSALEQT
jgi:hypothetical protein